MVKDPSNTRLLSALGVSERGWVIIDHWEADLCAVGIAHPDRPHRLVYVCTFEKPPGRYYVECEIPIGSESHGQRSALVVEDSDFTTLVEHLEQHQGDEACPRGRP